MRARYFWPMVLIIAGALFLLDNLGVLPGSAWGWIFSVVLILLGVSLLWPGRRGFEMREISVPLEGAASAQLTLKHGAGHLSVRAGTASELLLAGAFGGGVEQALRREGDRLEVILSLPPQAWDGWMWPGRWQGGLDWSLALNPNLPLVLNLEGGAAENRVDLAALRVTDLTLKTGASSTTLTLPAQAGQTRVRIESGAASVEVTVPPGVAGRIRGVVGVGALNVDTRRFPRRDGEYRSEDYETAPNRVDLEIRSGVGAVEVR